MELKDLQANFQRYLMQSDIQNILSEIMPDERFSAPNRLNVYHSAYRIRLFEILKLDYPKTYELMGDDEFRLAFIHYLEQHPSHHFSVRYFGQHFRDFLANTKPFNRHSLFSEMVAFEWAIAYTFDAKDAPVVKQEDFAKIPPEKWPELLFTLHPSVTSVHFEWDTPQLWQLIETEQPERPPVKQPQPIRWLFWRKALRSYFQSCNPAEESMFQALQKGLNFGEICESLLPLFPEDQIPQIAAQTLYKWVTEEMISSIQ